MLAPGADVSIAGNRVATFGSQPRDTRERSSERKQLPRTTAVSEIYSMAPSADRLEDALRSAVEEVYRSEDQNNLTVRFVRDKVENELELDPGFFVRPEWKDKSKNLIKSWAVCTITLQNHLLLC
jgi:hypothetical protein